MATVDIRELDGIALSPDGSLWGADIESGVLEQLDPAGRERRHIDCGFPHATSCVNDASGAYLIVTVLRTRPITSLRCDGAVISIPVAPPETVKEPRR